MKFLRLSKRKSRRARVRNGDVRKFGRRKCMRASRKRENEVVPAPIEDG